MQSSRPRTLSSTTLLAAQAVMLSLPFMSVLSINVGFPLKIYEIVIALSTCFAFVSQRFVMFDRTILKRGFLFFLYAVVALVINVEILDSKEAYDYLARFSPFVDGILKCFYVLLCFLGFNLAAGAAERAPQRIVRFWLMGATASAAIHLLFFSLTAAGYAVPRLPGMPTFPSDVQFQTFMGITAFRAGTFMEGNYAGPFFVLSLLVALHARAYRLALLYFACILASFSTTALIGLMVAGVYYAFSQRKNVVPIILLCVAFALFASSPLYDSIVKQKLNDQSESSSSTVRKKQFYDALDLFAQHPILGLGISQYGLYVEGDTVYRIVNGTDGPSLNVSLSKSIPNSVYVELISEFGGIGIVLFVFLLVPTLKLARQCPSIYLRAGVVAILVFWLASPTFTLMYYWAFFGVICGITRNWLQQGKVMRGKQPGIAEAAKSA
jgi:hypothetical protein